MAIKASSRDFMYRSKRFDTMSREWGIEYGVSHIV